MFKKIAEFANRVSVYWTNRHFSPKVNDRLRFYVRLGDGYIWGVFALFVLASGLMIVDQHCGSRFNILDGSMIDGPSQYPLKMYHTSYDGRRLRVYS